MFQNRGIASDATHVRGSFEDLSVGCRRRGLDSGAISHTTQKRLVCEVLLIEVGGEEYELLKWDFDLFSGVEREVINTTLERHDPTIQKILRGNALPAEVVDNQRAAIRFHLEWRLVELG